MKSESEIIDEALTHLVPSSPEEIKDDIKAAKQNKKANNSTKYFIKNFGNESFKKEKDRIKFDKEICIHLKRMKKDFIPLFQIYNILTNKNKSYKLQKYFIIKKDGENNSLKNGIKMDLEEPVIIISLGLLYDENTYYSNFVKGILKLMKSNFEHSYIMQYCPKEYFDNEKGKNYYKDNEATLIKCLENVLKDINRVLYEDESNQNRYEEKPTQTDIKELKNKMPEDKFKFLIKRARLKYDNILMEVYRTSLNDNDILLKIKELAKKNEDKYFELECNIDQYNEINSIKMENKNLNEKINKITKQLGEQEVTIGSQNKTIEQQNEKIGSQNKTIEQQNEKIGFQNKTIEQQNKKIADLNTNIVNLTNENASINEKVNFMQKIVYSSLSRKVIKHCMNKILIKYKDSINILKNEKNDSFKIKFKKDINKVPIKEANELIDSLYEKKDTCNNCVHFQGIKKPKFIDDVWDIVINFIELNEKEKENFNKIFTNDIKDSFEFSQKDEPVSIKKEQ